MLVNLIPYFLAGFVVAWLFTVSFSLAMVRVGLK